MSNEEIIDLIENKGLTIEKLLDVVIDYNGIIGVGLITLSENVSRHIKSKINSNISYE